MTRVLLVVLAAACAPPRATPSPGPIPADASQLVLVTSPGWDDVHATVRRYQREGGAWRAVGEPIPAVLGRSGLAWGRGLHGDGAPAGRSGPVKEEGDGKSTAGVFRLGAVYGRDQTPPAGSVAPYTPLGATWRCVDDPASRHYNRVLDEAGVDKDWASAEDMWAIGSPYDLVVWVDHNDPPLARRGSCIFLHVWRSADDPTAGCTAMPKAALAELIAWLRPGQAVIAALPEGERADLQQSWRLP